MKTKGAKYLASAGLGILLLGSALFLLRFNPSLKVPALPGIHIPLTPFLLLAGTLLTVFSLWLYFVNKNED